MKKMMLLFSLLVAACCMTACSDDNDGNATLSLSKAIYVLDADLPLDVVVNASKAVSKNTAVKFRLSGTAVEGEDYSISGGEFVLNAGESSAKVVITPLNNFTDGRDIKIELEETPGFAMGANRMAIVTVAAKEPLIYSFSVPSSQLTNKREVKIKMRGLNDKNYTSKVDLHIPFEIATASTAVLGTNFKIEGDVKEFVIPAGKQEASIVVNFVALDAAKDKLVLKLNQSAAVNIGSYGETTIKIVGPTSFASMVGTWKYNNDFASRWWLELAVEPGSEADLNNLPTDASSAGTIEFATGEIDTMIMNLTGDLAKYLRNCSVTFVNEQEDELADTENTDKLAVQYMKLSVANESFSSKTEKLRPVTVGFRFLEEGKILQMRIIDYKPTEFLVETYDLWFDDSVEFSMKDFFPLSFNFVKVDK